jgi:hypothetical protein
MHHEVDAQTGDASTGWGQRPDIHGESRSRYDIKGQKLITYTSFITGRIRANRNNRKRLCTRCNICMKKPRTHKSKSSAPAGAPPTALPVVAFVVNDPNPPVAGDRAWLCAPQIPACAFSFSRSRMLLPAPADAEGLLVAAEPRDIDHKSSNPPPPDLAGLPGKGVGPPLTGDATAERAAPIAGIAAYEGAETGVELGRTCDEGVSTVLNAPNGCVCAGCVGR